MTGPDQPEPGTSAVSVEVEPSELEGWPGDTVRLRATARDDEGKPVPGASFRWSSDDTAVAAVDDEGLVTLGASGGTTGVSVALRSEPDLSASARATNRGAKPDTVIVTPASATVAEGDTLALEATVRDASGDAKSIKVTWSSSDPETASVSESGVVTGRAVGSVAISAEAGPASGGAEVTVTAPDSTGDSDGGAGDGGDPGGGGDPGAAAPCESPDPAWIWCDDFEQDRLGRYFEHNDAGGAFVREAGVGRDGSAAMRARYASGAVSVGWLHLAFGRTPGSYFDPVDAGDSDYREIYWRLYVRNQDGWIGGGGDKLSRAIVFATSGWAEAMVAHVWSGGRETTRDYLVIDPASGTDLLGNLLTTGYNDPNLRWLGAARGDTPLFGPGQVGQWHCVEAHVRLNDPGSANGVFELWVDGVKDAERTGLNWVGAYQDYGINAVFVENYWNDGSPQAQERYLDDFVVSTERIGC